MPTGHLQGGRVVEGEGSSRGVMARDLHHVDPGIVQSRPAQRDARVVHEGHARPEGRHGEEPGPVRHGHELVAQQTFVQPLDGLHFLPCL